MATIRITREPAVWRDRLSKSRVYIDGRQVGAIASAETHDFRVAVGEHRVQLKSVPGWFTSRARVVSVGDDQIARLVCRAGGPAIESVLVWLHPGRYISLDSTE